MSQTMRNAKRHCALALILFCTAGFTGTGATQLPGPVTQKDKNNKPAASTGIFSPDKGKFRVLLEGKVVGNEEFEISPSGGTWLTRDSTTAHAPDGTNIKATGQLRLSPDGTPIHYEWSAQTQKRASGVVDFAGGTAKSAIDLGGKSPFLQEFSFPSPRVAVLDNNLYYQYAVLALLYDWNKGGKQEFPVLIPQDSTPGSISVESLGSRQVDSGKYEALRVSSPDLEILLYLDANHRLMRLDVPSSKATIERE